MIEGFRAVSVEMGIHHRATGDYQVVPVATIDAFRLVWLPACERLGLELVPLFAGGALSPVPAEMVLRVVAEVTRLRDAAAEWPDGDYLADRCLSILAAFARTDPAAYEYDFG